MTSSSNPTRKADAFFKRIGAELVPDIGKAVVPIIGLSEEELATGTCC